ncbi:MAG: FimB/Mfa2 family fimbrial subunit, partial [Odoribacteraceae bacterium]|nr:FimB/Mfa2 family fimbrial subunit [Odoribacteraceae bacterium]
MKKASITGTLNDARLSRQSRQVESFVVDGREQHACRNLSIERSRFFFSCRVIAGEMTRNIGIVALLMVTFAIASCSREVDISKNAGDGSALVTLSLTMPATPATRMTDVQENNVETIDVLLFATGDDRLYYRAHGTSISGVDAQTKQFDVKLPVGAYNIVVLANARGLIPGTIAPATLLGGDPPATTATGDPRASVLQGLVITSITDGQIPMWGYRDALVISETNASPIANIALTRAVARVDVSLGDAIDNFELKRVYLYNYSNAGSISPAASAAADNVDGYDAGQWQEDPLTHEKKAIAPNIPVSATKVEGPQAHVVPAGQERAFKQAIYAFEAAAGVPVDGAGWGENTCLVVGGKYDGGNETYYRVEFVTTDGPLALTRNHLYNVVIKQVSGHGWTTADDAYKNLPSNIVVQITEWNDGGLNDVTFNDQYYLAVDKSGLDFNAEKRTKTVRVATDYPRGWKIDIPDEYEAWLSVTPASHDGSEKEKPREISVTVEAIGLEERAGHFYIIAGNLKKKITIAQSTEPEFSLSFEPGEVVFYAGETTAKTVAIEAFPSPDGVGYTLSFEDQGNIEWSTPADFASLPATTASLSLLPAGDNLSGSTRGSMIRVTFTEVATSRSITKTINARHLSRPMLFTATLQPLYPAMAGAYTCIISSEGAWKLSLEDPLDASWLGLEEEVSYHPAVVAYIYTFTLADNPAATSRTAKILVSSSDEGFPADAYSFEIVQAGAAQWTGVSFSPPPYNNGTLELADMMLRLGFGMPDGDYVLSPFGDVSATVTTNAAWYLEAKIAGSETVLAREETPAAGSPVESALSLEIPSPYFAETDEELFSLMMREVTVTAAHADGTLAATATFWQLPYFLSFTGALWYVSADGGTVDVPVFGCIPETNIRVAWDDGENGEQQLWASNVSVGPIDGTELVFDLEEEILESFFSVECYIPPCNDTRQRELLLQYHAGGSRWITFEWATQVGAKLGQIWQDRQGPGGTWQVQTRCPEGYHHFYQISTDDDIWRSKAMGLFASTLLTPENTELTFYCYNRNQYTGAG